ncbi:nucleoporin NUP188-like isoform X2 [Patiria miniata]|uniref:Nucleoporin NUP188 n=1 Tax=Patiria miniata TaxID=46514 RepID=A0A913Z561_PATMI|nr:nucleoporin NUP188-like isoform X2 [Patiria miniata]
MVQHTSNKMAPSTTRTLRCNHELLQIISGRSAVKAPSLIAEELSTHESLFLHGLQYYKQQSKEAETKLKDDKNVSKLELQFLQQLGQFLDLDAVQCKDLFEAYILNAFRGTGAQLQSILKDERSVQALLQKVWEYYFTERMMLLHCIKHLLSFLRDSDHPFQEQYLECVLNLEKSKVYDKLLLQYETSFNAPVPTRQKRGPLMSERHSIRWCLQALTEQCELLEIILLYVRGQEDPSENLLNLAQLFQKQAFGTRQPYRHLLDAEESAHHLTARISFLCSMLLVESMNLDPLIGLPASDKPSSHRLASNEKLVGELSSIIQNLGSQPSHGPVLIAWLVLHGTLWPEADMTGVRRLGQQAVQLQVFCYISSQLRTLSTEKKSVISLMCHVIVYTLLTLVLTLFREDTLGTRDDLIHLACQLLKQPQLCQEFWDNDIEGGIFSLLHSSTNSFPLDFNPLLQLLTPLTSEGSKQVFAFLEHLPTFTEPLDNNRSVDLQSTNQKGVWKLMQDKILLPEGDHCQGFIIPAGSLGSQLQRNRVDLIRWSFDFSGWWLFHSLIDWLLVRIRQGSIPSGVQVSQSEAIIDLVTHTLEADWSLSSKLQPITDCLYQLLSSLTSLTNPPLGLLSVCLKCIGVLAKHQPRQVWQSIQKSGFLPHTGNVYSNAAEAISGEGIYPAEYGKLLVSQEQPTGEYPVTLEFLRLLKILLEGLCTSDVDIATHQDLLACVVFVQREIFSAFHNWRYAPFDDREEVGKCSLDIFHIVLHVLPTIGQTKAAPFVADASKTIASIRETCVHGFLYTPAGEALLYIIASGIDILEQRIIDQGSTFECAAERLSQLIKLSLSILNRLLLLKPPGQPPCPLVQTLTSHTTGLPHQPHLIGLIAGYIYHRHDPRLPTLATLLLKRVAMVAPMSIFGCLGSQAAAIRDIYLSRLQAHSEDERLKVGILELLTVAVETQPGLSELFLNLEKVKPEPGEQSEAETSTLPSSTKVEIGKISCLHAVLDTIEEVKQGTTHCPPDLHCAALGFLQALWLDCRETALSVLRIRPKFWDDVAAPLFKHLPVPEGGSQSISSQIKIRAYAFKILALECYYVSRENLQKDLKTVLKKLKQDDRYTYWSKCIHTLLESAAGQQTDCEEYLIRQHELLVLIQAWRTFLLVSASPHGKAMELSDSKIQSVILSDIAASIHCQSHQFDSVLNQKACSLLSSLYMSLLTHWTNIQVSQWKHMDSLVAVLERIMDSDSPGLSNAVTSITTALTTLLKQRTSKQALHVETIESLLPIICLALQYSSHFYLKLPSTTKQSLPSVGGYAQGSDRGAGLDYGRGTVQGSVTASGLSSTITALKDVSGRPAGTRSMNGLEQIQQDITGSLPVSKYSMPTIAAYLLDELLVGEKLRVSVWLPLLRQHGVLNLLLTTLQSCMQVQQGLHYTEAVLLLLLDLASIPQAAESMQTSGLIQQICLPLLQLHQQNGEAMLTGNNMAKSKKTDTLTWLSIYRHSISVVTVMLGTLQHSFLPDALDFFGVHRERMMQCLDAVRYNQSQACLMEAETTSAFIYQLSHFAKELGSRMRTGEVQGLLLCVTSLCHCCVALLIRPKLLQYLTEKSTKHTNMNKQERMVLTMNGTPIRLRQQTSTTDLAENKYSLEVQHIQARLLVILGHGLAALRHFSPDLLTILLNPSVDILEYQMLLGLGFSTPTLETDIEPSFGLLISCINMCVQLLSKLDCSKTSLSPDETAPTILPVSGSSMPAQQRYMDRPMIMFILETSVELLMVQGLRCLKDPTLPVRDRQIVKRELGTELATFLQSLQRYFRRGGGPSSPSSASPSTSSTSLLRTPSTSILSKSSSHTLFSQAPEQAFFRVVQHFMQQILR